MKTGMLLLCCLFTLTAGAQQVLQRIILIGDAGELHTNGRNPVVDAVRSKYNLQDPQQHNTVLFLGDNVYPLGLPDPLAPSWPTAKEILDYQANLVKGTAARGIIIPGNHDWKKSKPEGWQTIRRQQAYIDSLQLPNLDFLPKEGCPGPIEVPISETVTLVVMDSEWWLFPYEKPGETSACDCKNKEEILATLDEISARNRGKILLFAAHHPFRSYGIHGGYYTIKQHIFPLTDLRPGLYVPLPVIGSIYPIARGVFGTHEDLPHPLYRQMVHDVENVLRPNGPVIFVSGHDHCLQYIEDNGNAYVVSGSGSKHTRVKKGSKSLFASTDNGFSVLELMSDSTVQVHYYNTTDLQHPMFSHQVLHMSAVKQQAIPAIPAGSLPATVKMAPDSQYNRAGRFHRFILGENYRKVWDTPLDFPVIDLHRAKGGLKISRRGGGQQTRSLRLEDSTGTEYVLRSLKKYPAMAVPEALRETVAKDVVQDQISASNPYAPLVVSSLAKAAGIPATNPTFVYLPKDTTLGIYANAFGNDVYLFEEREPKIGVGGKTYNTEKVLEKTMGDNDSRVSQPAVLNARLLDMFVMDWDRHEDQWRWYKEAGKKREWYYPIPRDRDQAFFVNNGVLPRMASRAWLMPKIQGFRKTIPNINGFSFNARYFDRSFLNELSKEEWQKSVDKFLGKMTDSVLTTAVNRFPDSIRAITGNTILETLQARRSILADNAMKYYRFLAREVDIPGTAKNELFSLTRLPDGKLGVDVYKISKKGEIEQSVYSRIFDPADTKEVNIYGLGGQDRFEIKGSHRLPMLVRLIGGADKDVYIDSAGSREGKRIRIYDLSGKTDSFAISGNEKLHLSRNPDIIAYNRKAFKYEKLMPLLTGGYNRDDGLLLGLGLQYIGQGWRKEPFASKQTFLASHALATKAYHFRYRGEFTDVIRNADLLVFADAKAPHNTTNFFGFGNETVFDKSGDKTISYYRARYNLYQAEALLKSKIGNHMNLAFGPGFTYYELDKHENDNRYITKFASNGLDSASLYNAKYYASARVAMEIDTRNNELVPSRGIHWLTTLLGSKGLNNNSRDFASLKTDLSLYMSFRVPANVVIVSRFGGGVIWGDYEFFQAFALGGTQNLRGYRNYRFAGRAGVYNNTEVRVKLFEFRSYLLPGSVGLIGFNDVGRVWQSHETSHVWHDGYGGGIYVSPVNLLVITAVIGHSKEETLPYVTLGFKF